MINVLSNWAKNLGVVMVLVSIIEMILPNNNTKKYIKVVLGIFVIFNIISPFIKNKDELSLETINIENYKSSQNEIKVDQTSMNKRIKELYEKQLEKDIKSKIEEYGYNVENCKVKTTIEEKNDRTNSLKENRQINPIKENNNENNSIEKIELKIVNSKSLNSQDIKNICEFITKEYGVNEKCLKIN